MNVHITVAVAPVQSSKPSDEHLNSPTQESLIPIPEWAIAPISNEDRSITGSWFEDLVFPQKYLTVSSVSYLISTVSHTAAKHPSNNWGSPLKRVNRATSSANSKDAILKKSRVKATLGLLLDVMSLNNVNRSSLEVKQNIYLQH